MFGSFFSRGGLFAPRALFIVAAALAAVAVRAADGFSFVLAGPAAGPIGDGALSVNRLPGPVAVLPEANGDLIVAETTRIRRISWTNGTVVTLAGSAAVGGVDGTGLEARFQQITDMVRGPDGNLYLLDAGLRTVRRMDASGVVTTVAGVTGVRGHVDAAGPHALFNEPVAMTFDRNGNLFVADYATHVIRKIDRDFNVTTLAGLPGEPGLQHGSGPDARFRGPRGIAADASGNLFVADTGNRCIRKISSAGVVSLFAGTGAWHPFTGGDGTGVTAYFTQPWDLAIDAAGRLVVSDRHILRLITPRAEVTTFVPSETPPWGDSQIFNVTVDPSGDIYVSNFNFYRGRPWVPPAITTQPRDVTVASGQTFELSVAVTGFPAPIVQWLRNGFAVSQGVSSRLQLTASAQTAGRYTAIVTSAAGSVTSAAATVTLQSTAPATPTIAVQPRPAVLSVDAAPVLSVTATGSGTLAFQWERDGEPIAGATSATYAPALPGSYRVVVTNAAGSVASEPAVVTAATHLVNLATRGSVNGTDALVAGFVVRSAGTGPKQFLIRGVGPTLGVFGVPGALARPSLTVYRGNVAAWRNAGWETAPNTGELVASTRAVGAFPLATGAADAAVLVNVEPGAYTVEVEGLDAAAGTALVEIYEARADQAQLVNLSARGRVTAAANLTAGIVINGASEVRLLVRAIGPGLGQFGLPGFLPRATLTLRRGDTVVGANTRWGSAANATEIPAATTAAGGFALPADSEDAELLLRVPPGNYTAEVSGTGGATGIALVEVYQLP